MVRLGDASGTEQRDAGDHLPWIVAEEVADAGEAGLEEGLGPCAGDRVIGRRMDLGSDSVAPGPAGGTVGEPRSGGQLDLGDASEFDFSLGNQNPVAKSFEEATDRLLSQVARTVSARRRKIEPARAVG